MSSSTASESPSWLGPSWIRLGLAALVAVGAFLLPQEIPLEWYPLNNPGTDINYLEISCAANVTGEVQILYDLAVHGHRPIDTIRWPISPTTQTYTYTFPLPDAPIVELRVKPPLGGELTIRQMRIINRRNEEIRRFTYDLFRVERDSVVVTPSIEGWKLISVPGATNPSTRIELFSPIIPVDKDHRNLLRCLLSTGYLALMLLILLLAVLTATYRPRTWRDFFVHAGFLASLALSFAFVGNRGLIKNSIHYARYSHPSPVPGLRLEFDLISSGPSQAQVFWDTGSGISESESERQEYQPHQGLQHLRFNLPVKPLKKLRFDPRSNEGRLEIRGIRIVDTGQCTAAVLPLASLHAIREIAKIEAGPDGLTIEVTPKATDPITEFSPAAVEIVNQAVASRTKQ